MSKSWPTGTTTLCCSIDSLLTFTYLTTCIYSELGNALKSLIALRGVGGLWKGLGPTLLRDVPFSGIYWGVYESIKAYYDVTLPEIKFTFVSGAVAGSVRA